MIELLREHGLFIITIGFATLALLLFLHTQRIAQQKKYTSNMPEDLRSGSLFLCEKNLTITKPLRLAGKPDEVWEREDRVLIMVDTKNREKFKTTTSDRNQLTGYALLMKYHPISKGRKIANYGYIRIPSETGDVFKKVKLLTQEQYQNLHTRHRLLKEGKVAACGPKSVIFCNGCGHQDICKKTYSKRS